MSPERSVTHVSERTNELEEILKPPSTAKKLSIVGGNNALGEGRLSFISLSVIDLLLYDASKSAAFHRFCALSF
jgi:hypothetical protein